MQQVQTQNDKMVPIDTSGDPVEVELKEDNQTTEKPTTGTKEDTPVVEIEETSTVKEIKEDLKIDKLNILPKTNEEKVLDDFINQKPIVR